MGFFERRRIEKRDRYRKENRLVCPTCSSVKYGNIKPLDTSIVKHVADGIDKGIKSYFHGFKEVNMKTCFDCENKFIFCPYCTSKINGINFISDIKSRLPTKIETSCGKCYGNIYVNVYTLYDDY